MKLCPNLQRIRHAHSKCVDFLRAAFREVILPWYAAKVLFVLPASAWKWEANLQRIHHMVAKVWNFRQGQFVG